MRETSGNLLGPMDLFSAVPLPGARIAAAVYTMMQDQGHVAAMARAILAYQEWLQMQPHMRQMLATQASAKVLQRVRACRVAAKESDKPVEARPLGLVPSRAE